VYTVTITVHCSCYCSPCIRFLLLSLYCTVTVTASSKYSSNTDFDCLTELNNNVNGQLILRMGKLMEETASIFWVNLGYRLHSPLRDLLQGSWGMTDIPSVLLLFHCFHSEITITVTEYLVVWFGSASGNWGHAPEYIRDHLKHGQCLQPISFNNLGPWLIHVVGVVWDASTAVAFGVRWHS